MRHVQENCGYAYKWNQLSVILDLRWKSMFLKSFERQYTACHTIAKRLKAFNCVQNNFIIKLFILITSHTHMYIILMSTHTNSAYTFVWDTHTHKQSIIHLTPMTCIYTVGLKRMEQLFCWFVFVSCLDSFYTNKNVAVIWYYSCTQFIRNGYFTLLLWHINPIRERK